MPESLSRTQARRICIRAQGLDGAWPGLPGPQAVARTVEHLGYVQIDTIAVVERAHHHTLWRRQPGYTPAELDAALSRDRSILEAWYPAASYVPMAHYRYTLQSMRATAEWYRDNWRATGEEDHRVVLDRIRAEGPLMSADFEAPRGHRREGWWSWKPAKRTLEQLFVMGEVMVSARRNFQRVYDLTERVLPPGTDTRCPDDEELGRFLAAQALRSTGIASTRNQRWRAGAHRDALGRGLAALAEEGTAVPVRIEGITRGDWYVTPEALSWGDTPTLDHDRAQILSPFDSLIINRAWLKAVWSFDYAIECYLPKAKRKYGYFCLPILWQERFVARIDLKADRAAGVLRVQGLWLEPDVAETPALRQALGEALSEFAKFNECEEVDAGEWGRQGN